jgi:predicted transcriptional regulator
MRPERYDPESLVALLQQRKIATMDDLKEALGTSADATVFRKLALLEYRTSYSHRGRYYTLDEVARFDELGLWSFRQVWFSRFGTLVSTVEALVSSADAGYDAAELEAVLNVEAKAALLKLVRSGRLARQQVAGRYVYLSTQAATRRAQLAARSVYDAEASRLSLGPGLRVLPDELKAAIVLFYSFLDERQRRLYAGLEAMKVGHGGDAQVAELLGIDPGTVARGRGELLAGDIAPGRARRPGGGRPSVKTTSPR